MHKVGRQKIESDIASFEKLKGYLNTSTRA